MSSSSWANAGDTLLAARSRPAVVRNRVRPCCCCCCLPTDSPLHDKWPGYDDFCAVQDSDFRSNGIVHGGGGGPLGCHVHVTGCRGNDDSSTATTDAARRARDTIEAVCGSPITRPVTGGCFCAAAAAEDGTARDGLAGGPGGSVGYRLCAVVTVLLYSRGPGATIAGRDPAADPPSPNPAADPPCPNPAADLAGAIRFVATLSADGHLQMPRHGVSGPSAPPARSNTLFKRSNRRWLLPPGSGTDVGCWSSSSSSSSRVCRNRARYLWSLAVFGSNGGTAVVAAPNGASSVVALRTNRVQ